MRGPEFEILCNLEKRAKKLLSKKPPIKIRINFLRMHKFSILDHCGRRGGDGVRAVITKNDDVYALRCCPGFVGLDIRVNHPINCGLHNKFGPSFA